MDNKKHQQPQQTKTNTHPHTTNKEHTQLPVSIDYLYDVGEIAGVRPVRAVCEGTAVLRPTSTHPLGVRLEEA